MPKRKYYKILGLEPGASEQALRKSYRRLVMKYHPDRNQAPGAEEKFIAITEAYEILTGKKAIPTTRKSKTKTTATPEQQKEERVKEARARYQEQVYREYVENEQYFQKLTSGPKWKTMRISAFVG
ncbi:MAG: J domain-containing protein, partial [Crocinitomicaceae bacterium]|nr:J domain-containing protein [Crocinitomicaceae bacterium]